MDDLPAVEAAVAALEAQRGSLGDAVVDTALGPLLEKRDVLRTQQGGEQRRLVTVLFADLVDFTVLAQAIDAEDVRSVLNRYFAVWHDAIEEHGGVVEKFIGDAVMAVFGLYRAQEDDPERAIRAALAMQVSLASLNEAIEQEHGVRLTMRVGIDTGDVVVGTLGDRPGQEFVVVGETVNRAARLQAAAASGAVMISRDTHRHIRGAFSFQAQPGLRLKGITEPADAFVVLGRRPSAFRLAETPNVEGVETRTVGRELELRRLQNQFRDVADERHWRVVTLLGDAGVGKSRLLHDFDTWLAEMPDPVWWFRGRAAPATTNVPNALLRDVLAARLEIRETDGPDTVRTKWQRGVAEVLGVESGTTKALVLALWLGFEVGDAPAVHSVRHDPEGLSDRAAGYLAEYLENLARQNPVVMLLEDLHWADENSLSWFDGAAATLRERRVLVVGTARPALFERHPHWGEGLEHHSRLSLERLSRRESRELVAEILQKADRVPVALFDLIVEVAEGNPFYVEELVKWLIEVEVITRHGEIWHVHEERVASVEVPPTLKGLLQARLDALPPHERVVAQRASVIGRVFWDDAVDYLAGESPAPASGAVGTNDALNGLRTREVVQRRERSAFDGTTEFLFKHALLRDVAYDGVLKAHRRTFHSLAARWLEQTTGRSRRGDEYAGLIAEHYDHAGDPSAPGWYLQAGRQAAAVHANPEAARLLTRGLELAPESAPTLRFDLLLAREAILDRAGDRVAQEADFLAMEVVVAGIDDPVRRSRLLVRRSNWAFARSDYAASAAAARESATQARAAGRADLEAEGRLWEGKSLVWAGQNDEALAVLDGALQQARAVGAYRLVGECLRYLSTLANNRSDFALARQRAAEALDVYRQHEDLEGESVALSQLGTICYNEGRHDEARAYIEQSIPAFRLSGHRYREAVAIGNLATVLLQEGYFATGRRMMMESLELCRRLGDREGQATDMGVLADLARATGDWRRARSEYGAALAATQEIGFARLASDLELGLALVCVAEGNTAEALDRASRAVELGATADSPMSEARARLASGYVFRHAGQLDDAAATLIAALGLADQLDLDYLVIESRAILADVTRLRGDDDASVELVTEVVPNLTTALLMGCLQPGELLLALHRVLAPAHDARTQGALATAKAYLDELSARIGDDTLRTGFLERVPAHVELARLISG